MDNGERLDATIPCRTEQLRLGVSAARPADLETRERARDDLSYLYKLIAAAKVKEHFRRGDRAVIIYRSVALKFMTAAYFGALLAGCPAYS